MNTQEFIEKAKKIHGDKYDYSKVEYLNAHTKVCIICPKHGEFWQAPRHHLNGSGCPYCDGKIRLTTEEFIRRAKEVHGDKYDYSKVKYMNGRTKVCIICPKHGEFWQTASEHLRGQGCPKCVQEKRTSSREEFIHRANEVHGNRYDYSKVEYINALKKVCIVCPKHGEFWQTPASHLSGRGCPNCAGKIRLTTEEFILRAKEVHGDKYDYSKVKYMNGPTKVCIICPKHGEFWQISRDHLQGQGCPKCAQEKKVSSSTMTTEEFIHKAKEVHGDKYDYSKVKYMNGPTKVCIICPKHGEFWQTPTSHLSGRGCPYCAGKIRLTTEEFIHKAKEVHGDKYDYSKVKYMNGPTKVCIICPKHGEFWQAPRHHLNGNGCPNCNESQMEKNTANFLEENNIEYIRQARKTDLVWLGRQSLDFYLPKYNIAIECQGIQHFESVAFFGGKREYSDGLKRDLSKYNKCLSNNVNLIYYVPESLVEEVINNTKYNNIYNSENVFSDLTEFNEKYLVI